MRDLNHTGWCSMRGSWFARTWKSRSSRANPGTIEGQERLGVHQDRRGNVRGEEHARDGAEGRVDGHGRRELLVPFEMQSRHRPAETRGDKNTREARGGRNARAR